MIYSTGYRNVHCRTSLSKQRGMTLIVAMIMLIMITLATITSYQISKTSLDIVGNMQFNNEAVSAANSAIQEAFSTTALFTTPTAALTGGCAGNNSRCFDFNNDGTNDLTVTLTPDPRCVQTQPIPNAALNLTNPNDQVCATGVAQVFGVQGAVTGTSLCSINTWEIAAVATDTATQINTTVTQGVSVRVTNANTGLSCP